MHSALQEAGIVAHDWEIRSFPTIGSTSTRVSDMLGLYEKVIVIAQSQSQGRGRQLNVWHSPVGGLWISFGLEVDSEVKELSGPLIHALHQLLSPHVAVEVKPPNDLLIDGKKVCGILVETVIKENRIKQVIVGIGINVTNPIPEEVKSIATRLSDHTYSPDIATLGASAVVICYSTLKEVLEIE
jgi:BirA family biotin operon repressor/biotin-[acetyl-CoA-carboxylase] ligase